MLQVVVDRLQISGDDLRQRLTDSIETAYLEGGGAAWAVELGASGSANREPDRDPVWCTCSPSGSSAGRAASRTRIRSRACSRSTIRSAPARRATGSGTSSSSTWTSSCRIRRSRSVENAIEPWSKPHYRTQLAELKRAAKKAKVRLDVPWADLTDCGEDVRRRRATATTRASAVSSAGSSRRNTRCTSACSSAAIAAT